MGFLDFAALLGGMGNEAANVRTQRAEQENANFSKSQSILMAMLERKDLDENFKQQATQAWMEINMEHLGYKKQGSSKNPIRKALEGMIGKEPANYGQKISQIGVGSGNAKTQVGGMAPPGGQGQPPEQSQYSSLIDEGGDFNPTPAPQPPPQAPAGMPPPTQGRFFKTPGEMAQEASDAEALKESTSRKAKLKEFDEDPVWQELKKVDKIAWQTARLRLAGSGPIEGSINPQSAGNWMPTSVLTQMSPEIAATIPKGVEKVTPFYNRNNEIVRAVPYYEDPSKAGNADPALRDTEDVYDAKTKTIQTMRYNPQDTITRGGWNIPVGDPKPVADPARPGALSPLINQGTGEVAGSWNSETGEATVFPTPIPLGRGILPTPELDRRTTLTTMIADTKNLAGLAGKNPDAIGYYIARWNRIKATGVLKPFGIDAPNGETITLTAIATNLSDQLLRARSGAQINEQEFERLRPLVPNPETSSEKFASDLKRFEAELIRTLNTRVSGGLGPNAQSPAPPSGPAGLTAPPVREIVIPLRRP